MFDTSAFITSIRWQDIVDIALNSYILFRLYVLFRGTNTFRVMIGIALLWVFQRVATFLGLIVTSWAIQGIMAAAALIIIIVFRNEIRSVLQAKNLKAILWGITSKVDRTPNEIICTSVFALSKKNCGALIVIPGKDELDESLQNGIPWDGVVSKEMLLSIFWPDNPVHDGAVVISGDRVTDVGVILPLSDREDLPTHYGTRHRSAVGLAEKTDALVVVVSEETGRVTVTKGSEIKEIQAFEELRRLLRQHSGTYIKRPEALKQEKTQLVLAGVVSVLFVLGIWFSFARGLEARIAMEIPVEYMNRASGYEIVDTSSDAVNLQLAGAGPLIKSIRPGQVKVRIDLARATAGSSTFRLTSENIILPPGIILKKIDPPVIDVTLDIPGTKVLPVQIDWVGKLPGDLIVEQAVYSPTTVKVVGGSRALEKIGTVYTEKVVLDNLTVSGELTVGLVLNPALQFHPDSKAQATITYHLAQRMPLSEEQ